MKVAIPSAINIQNQISVEMATIVIGGLKFSEITYVHIKPTCVQLEGVGLESEQ